MSGSKPAIVAGICLLALFQGASAHRWFSSVVTDGESEAEVFLFFHSIHGFWNVETTNSTGISSISLSKVVDGQIDTIVELFPTALEPVTTPVEGDEEIYGIFTPANFSGAFAATLNQTQLQAGLADGSVIVTAQFEDGDALETAETEELSGPDPEPESVPTAATIKEWVRGTGPLSATPDDDMDMDMSPGMDMGHGHSHSAAPAAETSHAGHSHSAAPAAETSHAGHSHHHRRLLAAH